jgi:hypothetical protein
LQWCGLLGCTWASFLTSLIPLHLNLSHINSKAKFYISDRGLNTARLVARRGVTLWSQATLPELEFLLWQIFFWFSPIRFSQEIKGICSRSLQRYSQLTTCQLRLSSF